MGGQLGDQGEILIAGHGVRIVDTLKDKAGRHLHKVEGEWPTGDLRGKPATLAVDLSVAERSNAITARRIC